MLKQFSREALLLGTENVEKLNKAKVVIFGIGGVGSYVVEGLARAGIGNFVLVDHDKVDMTNCNRQMIATTKTIGQSKVEVARARILEINPDAKVETYPIFFMPGSPNLFDASAHYVVDCVDTITAKIEIIIRAKNMGVPVISSMGTGNKLDPTQFEVADIYQTSVCPLAKVMRKELKARNVEALKVVYSKEIPHRWEQEHLEGKQTPASISFVPSVAGMIIAGEVIKDILKI